MLLQEVILQEVQKVRRLQVQNTYSITLSFGQWSRRLRGGRAVCLALCDTPTTYTVLPMCQSRGFVPMENLFPTGEERGGEEGFAQFSADFQVITVSSADLKPQACCCVSTDGSNMDPFPGG